MPVEIMKDPSSIYKKFTAIVMSTVSTRCHKTVRIKEETVPARYIPIASQDITLHFRCNLHRMASQKL